MSMYRPAVILLATLGASPAAAQVRTTQPPMINIFREFEKPGHFAAHEATEARWTALNRTHNYPYSYLALSAVSGPSEVWWVTAYDGLAAFGKGSVWGGDNAAYSAGPQRNEDGAPPTPPRCGAGDAGAATVLSGSVEAAVFSISTTGPLGNEQAAAMHSSMVR
jgi:hypothetical protein